jgi:formylglycine-generating enzyme required for sulfatase activity
MATRSMQARSSVHLDEVTRSMVWIPDGSFAMGSESHYPEEAPVHRVSVDGFWMDPYPVTNRDFRRFVEETKYASARAWCQARKPPNAGWSLGRPRPRAHSTISGVSGVPDGARGLVARGPFRPRDKAGFSSNPSGELPEGALSILSDRVGIGIGIGSGFGSSEAACFAFASLRFEAAASFASASRVCRCEVSRRFSPDRKPPSRPAAAFVCVSELAAG